MNKRIELVKKWLAAKDSVSYEELRANADAAGAAARATAYAAAAAYYEEMMGDMPDRISVFVYAAGAAADAAARTAYYVKIYEELTDA